MIMKIIVKDLKGLIRIERQDIQANEYYKTPKNICIYKVNSMSIYHRHYKFIKRKKNVVYYQEIET